MRANYYKVSRLVHPDKCAHQQAAAAAAAVNQAYDTLSNPVKKVLYDRFAASLMPYVCQPSMYNWQKFRSTSVLVMRCSALA